MVSIDISLLGQRLQKARKDMGLELSVLSSKVGITQESLRHIEHGIRKPSLTTLFVLAEELDVSLDYLTGRSPLPGNLSPKEFTDQWDLTAGQKQLITEILDRLTLIIKRACIGTKTDQA